MNPLHCPVLLSETIELLHPRPEGVYLDGTVGLGGHAEQLLQTPKLTLIGLDRDQTALTLCQERLAKFGARVILEHSCYADFGTVLAKHGIAKLDGVLLDLGVSSMQLDLAERGFSFRAESRLDMRMDQQCAGTSAIELVNQASKAELTRIISLFGEEPLAAKIAQAILTARACNPIVTTTELAAIVAKAYPANWRQKSRHHPATRTFQALRIHVNDELGQLERFLELILPYLSLHARLCVLTFHSLEDRMVKQTMKTWARDCICPPYVAKCTCGHRALVHILTKKPIQASAAEVVRNPRSSSAKLRCVEKL